jgi:copper resistance protein D
METAGLLIARVLSFAALLLVAGLPFHAVTLGLFAPVSRGRRLVLGLLALGAALASIWWALEAVAAMAGATLATLDQETFTVVLAATPLGAVMEWRLTALAGVVLAMVLPLRALRGVLATMAGAAALGTMAWTGHAGATEGGVGMLHRAADVVHLLAAATWLGALAAFLAAALGKGEGGIAQQLAAFARTGSVIVALLLLTGVVNTLAIAGWPMPFGGQWGWLLALKLALFGGMLGLAAINRWKITPALESGAAGATRHLQRSLALEFALGLGVVAVVGMLGVLDPSA